MHFLNEDFGKNLERFVFGSDVNFLEMKSHQSYFDISISRAL